MNPNETPNQPSATPLGDSSTSPLNIALTTESPASISPAPSKTSKVELKNLFQQWQFWGMVGMGFVAIIGIIFGVYGFNSDAEQRARADQLQSELDEANQLLVKYGTQLGIKVNEYGRPIGNIDDKDNEQTQKPTEAPAASSEYIYIGEWGIKLKIPDELVKVSYIYDGTDWQGVTSIRVTGLPKELDYLPTEAGEMPAFADLRSGISPVNLNLDGLGVLSRVPKDEPGDKTACPDEYLGEVVHSDKNYCYLYSHPQAVFSTDELEQKHEAEATKLVQELLTKNLSAF